MSALGDGMRCADRHHPRLAGHEISDSLTGKSWCPDFLLTNRNTTETTPKQQARVGHSRPTQAVPLCGGYTR
jgi:hypothetical protein